jgi:hypothetical protein
MFQKMAKWHMRSVTLLRARACYELRWKTA